jgi:hypothetical protein
MSRIAALEDVVQAQLTGGTATTFATRLIRGAAGLVVIAEDAAVRAVTLTAVAVHVARGRAARVPGFGAIVHAIRDRIGAAIARCLGHKIAETSKTTGGGASADDAGEAESVETPTLPLTGIAVRHVGRGRIVRAVRNDGLREGHARRRVGRRCLRFELCQNTLDRFLRLRVDGARRNWLPVAKIEPRVVLREGTQRAPIKRSGTLVVFPHEHEVLATGESRAVLDVDT